VSSLFCTSILFCFFFPIIRRPPISTLFPYTTLFRSVRRGLSLRDPRAIHRMRLEDLVGLLRERVHRLRGRLRGRLECLRLEDLAPDFVRVRVGDLRREAAPPRTNATRCSVPARTVARTRP